MLQRRIRCENRKSANIENITPLTVCTKTGGGVKKYKQSYCTVNSFCSLNIYGNGMVTHYYCQLVCGVISLIIKNQYSIKLCCICRPITQRSSQIILFVVKKSRNNNNFNGKGDPSFSRSKSSWQ